MSPDEEREFLEVVDVLDSQVRRTESLIQAHIDAPPDCERDDRQLLY